jgi:hypothetical protein
MAMAGTAKPLAHNTAAAPSATCEADCFIILSHPTLIAPVFGRRSAAIYFLKGRAFPVAHFCVRNARAQVIVGAVFNMPQAAHRARGTTCRSTNCRSKKMAPENRGHSKVLIRDASERENRSD